MTEAPKDPQKPNSVEIVEVGARDGLQNEPVTFSTEDKLELIARAMDAGVRRLEVASFVHPKLVPQMADAEAVVAGLPERDDITYIGLVLNKRGYFRAAETKVDEVGCVVCATDTFGQKNQGQTIEDGIQVSREIIELARRDGKTAQVTISTAFGCPFEGEVPQERVVEIARRVAEAGPREIAVADTVGLGVPSQVTDVVGAVAEAVGDIPLRAHFHNTRNTGIANAWAALEAGVVTLDSSMGGLGGCPFAPKATGNIATEDLLYMLERSGVRTGVDLSQYIAAASWLEEKLGRRPPAMVSQAGGFPTGELAA